MIKFNLSTYEEIKSGNRKIKSNIQVPEKFFHYSKVLLAKFFSNGIKMVIFNDIKNFLKFFSFFFENIQFSKELMKQW